MTPATALLRGLIRGYQLLIAPLLPPGICRFEPSCSAYGMDAIGRHGPWAGSWLTLRRLLRCHPWGGAGYDPVPQLKTSSESKTSLRPLHGRGCCPTHSR